jgi:hypothetical protein
MEAMTMRRSRFSRHAVVLGFALLVALGLGPKARAQHTPDPYNIVGEYNLGYEDYMYSNYPNGVGYVPNQGILQSRTATSRANQFQSYVEQLDGVGSGSDSFGTTYRGGGGIQPYYRAHRQYDDVFNRVYAPNEAADKTYYADQEARTKKYLEYLKESDPKKRAQLYREYNRQSLRAARDIGSGSARAAYRSGIGASERSTTKGSSLLRRPSSVPTPTNRPRATTTAPDLSSETPEQILERAELMDRANRAAPPARVPSRPAPR